MSQYIRPAFRPLNDGAGPIHDVLPTLPKAHLGMASAQQLGFLTGDRGGDIYLSLTHVYIHMCAHTSSDIVHMTGEMGQD